MKNNDKKKENEIEEDIFSINLDNLKKMDENSLLKLKTKLNMEYYNILYENEINTNKIIFYKKYIDQCKKNNNIEQRNEMIQNEFIQMRNKFSEINNEYLSLFDSLSSLTNRYSKSSQLSEKIYILENKIKEQENLLNYLNEKHKYISNYKSIEGYLSVDIFIKSSSENKNKTLNTIANNVEDIKKVNKLLTRNDIPKEDVEDYKNMLTVIHKKNYEHVTKDYQKILAQAQHELLTKNNNLKKLELIKNDIEMLKDPSKKNKILDEVEKINMEKNKEIEKKNEIKNLKKIYHEKNEEYEELKQELESLKEELNKENEKYKEIEICLNQNNNKLNEKIKEGNDIEIEFDEIKNERNLLIEQLYGNMNDNDK